MHDYMTILDLAERNLEPSEPMILNKSSNAINNKGMYKE
jgi:hypothetical protein